MRPEDPQSEPPYWTPERVADLKAHVRRAQQRFEELKQGLLPQGRPPEDDTPRHGEEPPRDAGNAPRDADDPPPTREAG